MDFYNWSYVFSFLDDRTRDNISWISSSWFQSCYIRDDVIQMKDTMYDLGQKFKSVSRRLVRQKKYDQAIDMISSCTIRLLELNELTIGLELANSMISLLKDSSISPTPQHIICFKKIYVMIMRFTRINKIHQAYQFATSFLRSAIKWTQTNNQPLGNPELHLYLARGFFSSHDYHSAQIHYIKSGPSSSRELSIMLVKWISLGYQHEADLFIARAVFESLVLNSLRGAIALLNFSKRALNELNTPLLNFCRFLTLACERNQDVLFHILLEYYNISLTRDPDFQSYLDQIGKI